MVSKRLPKVLIRTEEFKARNYEAAMIKAYENMEKEWFDDARKNAVEGKINKAGCCAVSALMVNNILYVANAGDSRSINSFNPSNPLSSADNLIFCSAKVDSTPSIQSCHGAEGGY